MHLAPALSESQKRAHDWHWRASSATKKEGQAPPTRWHRISTIVYWAEGPEFACTTLLFPLFFSLFFFFFFVSLPVVGVYMDASPGTCPTSEW